MTEFRGGMTTVSYLFCSAILMPIIPPGGALLSMKESEIPAKKGLTAGKNVV